MKIDKRKKYIIVLDVETTNNQIENKKAPNDGLVYDIGFVVTDKKGHIYAKRSFAIKDIIMDKELMNTAYYKQKLPIYWDRLEKKQMELVTIWQARQRIAKAIEYFNITEIYAYNANFDNTTLNNTVRYLSGSGCRWFFPYGTEICDIWHIACQTLGLQKTFQWENERNDKGNLTTSAERMFAYLSQDMEFEEEHTGLADALIETQILARCFKSHKSIDKKINRSCWRICQRVVA